MSGDDEKKRFSCDDIVHYKPDVSIYVQFKRMTKGSSEIRPDLNSVWQNYYRDNIKALEGDFGRIQKLILPNEDGSTSDAEPDPEVIKAAEEIIEQWRRQPVDAPLPAPAIERPPGHHLIVLLQKVLPKSVYERVYGQMIADARLEYCEALADGDFEEAKKIKRHLNYSLVVSVAAFVVGLPYHLLVKSVSLFDKGE